MFSKPTLDFVRALVITTRQPGWPGVKQGIEAELHRTYELMRDTQDIVGLRQLQGRARVLKEFLELAESAPQLLDKLTKGRM